MMSKTLRGQTLFSIGALVGMAAVRIFRQVRYELMGKTVFISGGSRGLGLLLAHEFASRGAKIAISGRDREALDRAADDLRDCSYGHRIRSLIETNAELKAAVTGIPKIRSAVKG